MNQTTTHTSSTNKWQTLFSMSVVLTLVVIVIHLFRIEYLSGFDRYFPFIAGAIIVHNIIPFNLRKYAFSFWTLLILSLTAGPLLAVGAFLIILVAVSITYLSTKIKRNCVAAFLFLLLIVARLYFRNNGFASTAIALGGLMIMLRFIFLLYEISFFKIKPDFFMRLNYLFMLPNIFFPLFPIVDPVIFFKHKEEDLRESIENGKTWMLRGILHLLLYRFVYLYFAPSIYELKSWYELLSFLLSGYALILRLSGIFCLSAGVLSFLGYKLPPVFENFFLVKNFRDLWRRINLYWRHFMWRVFYYPLLFKLKKWPQKQAVLFTVLVMFFVTWLLHGWQWYWVKGYFPLLANDILYWTLFGIILAYVSIRAFSQSKNKMPDHPFFSGIGIVGMFFAMSFLWSLWTSSSLTEWVYILNKFAKLNLKEISYLALTIIGLFLGGGIISFLSSKTKLFEFFLISPAGISRLAILMILICVGSYYHYGNHLYSLPLSKMVEPQLNLTDRMIVERGYYEQLLTAPKMSQEIQPLFKKAEVNDFENLAYKNQKGLLPRILTPDFHTTFKGKSFTTNSFGMRDKEYSLIKTNGVYRTCLLGGSYEMGSGVADGETYEQIVEDSLNKIKIPSELFNMGVGGYHVFQIAKIIPSIIQYHPEAAIYVCHSSEKQRMINNLLGLVSAGKDLEFSYLKSIVGKSGIVPGKMCNVEMYDRLTVYADSLLKFAYHEIASVCLKNNIRPVWVYFPAIGDLREDSEMETALRIAKSEGFEIIKLDIIFAGRDVHSITVSDEDTHPNAKGHQIIANALFPFLRKMIVDSNSILYLPQNK